MGLPPVEAIAVISQMGYRAVQWSATHEGMRPRDMDQSARRGLASHLRRLGLSCSGIDLFIPSAHFASASTVDRAMDAAAHAASLAASLGRCCVSLALPEPTEEIEERLAQVRRGLSEVAEREGVSFADHSLAAVSQGSASAYAVTLGVGVDPPALLGAGVDVIGAVGRLGSAIGCARVSDLLTTGLRAPAGDAHEARLDVDSYVAALAVIPLRSSPVADARQWGNPHAGLEFTLRCWQEGAAA
ncbi:MAG: hypothetical protein EXS03_00035 [Phycisphaerales bacterium]|nr:hypothetical protein [Phycisphaerales bacterium]